MKKLRKNILFIVLGFVVLTLAACFGLCDHEYKYTETAATCTEDGVKIGTCNHCGDQVVTILPATGHKTSGWIIDVAPTPDTEGSKHKECTVCHKVLSNVVIAALGHEFVAEVIAPTCTEKGYTIYTCKYEENHSYIDDYVDALGHSFGPWVTDKDSTCVLEGEKHRECHNCDFVETAKVELKDHSYSAVVTAPTCTEKGYTTHTCECGDSYVSDYVETIPHTYNNEITLAPTCTETGIMTYTCTCGDTFTEVIPANGHDNVYYNELAPTCTSVGHNAYEACKNCDHTTYVEIPMIAHSYTSEITTAPTCLLPGVKTFTCTCGDSYTEELAALGHNLESHVALAPTCETAGHNAYEACTRCDYTTFESVPAIGHDYVAVVTAPTCTEDGYTTYTCPNAAT